ncbi:MAG: potassium transporter Kup [Alphaproteobacteria bacterium]|nr:potassium transporter Kup [Alphaproteobacteria bacterium]
MTSTHTKPKLIALTLGSVGVVYGDIGTSPLYAFRESLAAAAAGGAVTAGMVLGVLSLILWALIITVTLKYVVLLLRADNQGEGGILSLMALAMRSLGGKAAPFLVLLGMAGVSLFYGDAIITPAISVLSAIEGLKLVTGHFKPYIVPLALAIMLVLFIAQCRGTASMGRFFGPIMVVWFLALGWGGFLHMFDSPEVWQAFNPMHAIYFLTHHGFASVIALGAVVLAVTGAEALYADMGHFGKKPIRLAWLGFVMPCLMLNYIGQAGLVLSNPEAAHQSFYLTYPDWALAPMVLLATMASIIASQAVISGAYSLSQQAVQLGFLPRLRVVYTSAEHRGQIYLPQVNWLLLIGVVLLIEIFKSSEALASAYGIAVTGTMVISSLVMFVVARHVWQWPAVLVGAVVLPLFLIDVVFLGANLPKLFEGGFVPVLIAIAMIIVMRTWRRGSASLHEQTRDYQHSMELLIRDINHHPPKRVEGTAIYLSSNAAYAPSALLQNLKHNKVLHEHNLIINIRFATTPHVAEDERVQVEKLCEDFSRVTMQFGYMEQPNVTKALQVMRRHDLAMDMMHTSYFISRRNIVPSARFGMPLWQDRIFIMLANNAADAAEYFHIPRTRVVELGVQMTV